MFAIITSIFPHGSSSVTFLTPRPGPQCSRQWSAPSSPFQGHSSWDDQVRSSRCPSPWEYSECRFFHASAEHGAEPVATRLSGGAGYLQCGGVDPAHTIRDGSNAMTPASSPPLGVRPSTASYPVRHQPPVESITTMAPFVTCTMRRWFDIALWPLGTRILRAPCLYSPSHLVQCVVQHVGINVDGSRIARQGPVPRNLRPTSLTKRRFRRRQHMAPNG